jgi:signal transduction histidine kinase
MSTEFAQNLKSLSEKFRIDLPLRYSEIERQFEHTITDFIPENILSLSHLLHRLTGSAGTFGLDKVSTASLKLEAFLGTGSPAESPPNKEILQHLHEQLSLEVHLASLCKHASKTTTSPIAKDIAPIGLITNKRIVVVEDDEQQAERYHHLLSAEGYEVTLYSDPNLDIFEPNCCCEDMPDLFIIDMMIGSQKHAGAVFIKQLQQQETTLPPVIFASVFDDFDSRLQAVRSGGSRYLVKPFADEQLLNSVRSLTEKETPPYRVLIIDDEQDVADYFVATMNNAGILAEAIANPLDAIDKIKQFKPELLLMDIHMPVCNGLELATMIRHQESYSKIPIIFLSADFQLQNRLSAMAIGADDFIQKGIEPYQIIASVKSRLNKTRLINSLTDNLSKERERAEKASQSKSSFLSFISHELKTPLNAILGYSQLLKTEDLSEEQSEMVDEIYASGEMQLGLINDLLDLAMIEAGKIKLNPEPILLNELINHAAAFIKLLAIEKNIAIEIDIKDVIELEADKKRLQQILLNLLSNAVKYNKNNGEIMLTVTTVKDMIQFTVVDTGQGISETALSKLFAPFERYGAEKTNIEGTGLGLGITKSLVELMGGHITVASTVDVGTVFTVFLPVTYSNI